MSRREEMMATTPADIFGMVLVIATACLVVYLYHGLRIRFLFWKLKSQGVVGSAPFRYFCQEELADLPSQ
jgi:hypothetical protein